MSLRETFGNIDVYLFDQLLRGNLRPDMRVLDAGCGHGRNLVWLLGQGAEAWGVDREAEAVEATRALGARAEVAELDAMPFEDAAFDAVLCNAVLHFAQDGSHFERMVDELGRVLRPGGLLFARLASSIGLEGRTQPLGGGRHLLPDGSTRYLVDEAQLLESTARLGAELVDPIKTTNVQGLRCMTTWVARKNP